jgi:serine/threonine-protein kinase
MTAPTPAFKRSFLGELQRRNVHRAAVFYAGAAWLLVQVATQVFPFFEVPNATVRIVVIATVIGFPFAMAFSWFYEWTPQGIKRESEIVHTESITRQTGKKLDKAIIAVLGLAVFLLLLNQFVLHRFIAEPAATIAASVEKSIAVLPLANSTGDPANEYFSDGVSEELISTLSRLSHLKVIGRTSSFQFKNKTDDSRAIGEKLGVGYLLEGSVRKSADRVRIAVELVQSADGANVWSASYDRDLKDIFAVQSEIATAVAEQLKIALLGNNAKVAAAPTPAAPSNQNLDAYAALLQGDFYAHRYTYEDGLRAVSYYEEAIRLDPGYALAYADLSLTAVVTTESFASGNAQKVAALAQARAAADKAMSLAPDLAEAHAARGYLLHNADFDLAAALPEYQRAYELAPQDASNLDALCYYRMLRGEFDQALDFGRRAVAADPLLSGVRIDLAMTLIATGDYDEAEAILHKSIELQPQSGKTHLYLSVVAILRGDSARALQEARQETEPFWRDYALALASFSAGNRSEADSGLQKMINQYPDEGASQIAMVYGLRRQPDEMFRWLEHARQTRDPGVYFVYANPFLSRYRDDPRFAALCRQLGLPEPTTGAAHT